MNGDNDAKVSLANRRNTGARGVQTTAMSNASQKFLLVQ
jgi:hypothetical protein